jgi:hypothetical protein
MSDDLTRLLRLAADDVPDQPDRYRRVQQRRAHLLRRRRQATALAGVFLLAGAAVASALTLSSPQDSLVASAAAPPTTTPAAPATPTPPPVYPAVDAATACPSVEPVPVRPALVGATRAYICSSEVRVVPGEGSWTFTVVRGVTGGLTDLLSVWSAPDDRTPPAACVAMAFGPLQVWLAGTSSVPVRAPTGSCGEPMKPAQRAYDALTTVVVSEARGQQQSTERSVASGCSDQYKDMVELIATDQAPLSTSQAPRPITPGTQVCIYRVDADDVVGQLIASPTLTAEQIDRINTLLPGVTPGRGCSILDHSRFALLEGGGSTTLIALDGCALMQDSTVWRTTAELRAELS